MAETQRQRPEIDFPDGAAAAGPAGRRRGRRRRHGGQGRHDRQRALRRRRFSTGEEFDASWNRGKPLDFRLGAGQVIAGWDQGIQGMKVGGRRRITIPPRLGYGDRGAGGVIKPGETLIFVVDLVDAR